MTWTSSDTTIATLSTDDPPIITGVAPGNATITAGGASADVTVSSGSALPNGTVTWSNPGDGSGVQGIYVAVPSDSGVDVFAPQRDGTVEAVRTDDSVAWSANVPPSSFFGRVLNVYMSGVWPGDGSTGETTGLTPISFVYYWIALQNAQTALNSNPPYTFQTADNDPAFAQLFQAMGTGLGNSTAHELGQQMAYKVLITMDCNKPGANQPCANGDDNVYELYGGSNWFYTHVYPAIHWQNPNNSSICAIHQYFDKGYLENTTCTMDLTK